jgi:hypothetical protein
LGEDGVVGFCSSQSVPNKFSMCSHEFPMGSQHIPQVSNSSSLYPISFALSSTLVTYITSPKEEITTYLIWDCSKLVLFLFFGMDQSKMPITKPKKKTLGDPHN